MPPLALLIKPASDMCNLECTYCFYKDAAAKRAQQCRGFMNEKTMKVIIKKALDEAEGSCSFGFQGGEPTLIGLKFYQDFVSFAKLMNYKGLQLNFSIQTNGYALPEQWAAFFKEHHFLVGVSLDGTIHTHNKYRRTAGGETTFSQVMSTIELLEDAQVDYNVLTVVNQATAGSAAKIYKFYRKNNFKYLQFIPCLDPLFEASGNQPYSLTNEAYAEFLRDLFDQWYIDMRQGNYIFIRQFENYLGILLGHCPEACDMNGRCSRQYVVEADGSVYPCDFYTIDKYQLGNFHDDSFAGFEQVRAATGFINESLIPDKECQSCRYYFLCKGGCKRYKNEGKNYFCSACRQFFDYSIDRFVQLAAKLEVH